MKFSLNTLYKGQDEHGNVVCCLECTLETANTDLRDRVDTAIRNAIAGVGQEIIQKQPVMGFHAPDQEEQSNEEIED